jgi:hypothetical protein
MIGKKKRENRRKCQVLTEEKLDEINARLENSPKKFLRCPAEEIRF